MFSLFMVIKSFASQLLYKSFFGEYFSVISHTWLEKFFLVFGATSFYFMKSCVYFLFAKGDCWPHEEPSLMIRIHPEFDLGPLPVSSFSVCISDYWGFLWYIRTRLKELQIWKKAGTVLTIVYLSFLNWIGYFDSKNFWIKTFE